MLNSKSVNLSFVIIFCLGYAFFLAGITRLPVPALDGAIRAVEARNILQTGAWFPIIYDGSAVSDHPPLYVWLSAICFKVFGVSDFAANIPARFAAFLTVIFTALIAFEVSQSAALALASSLILCFTRDFVLSSVRGYIEPIFTLFVYSSFYFALVSSRKNKIFFSMLSGFLIWFSFFSKGPPALWPLLFLLCFFFTQKNTAKHVASYFSAFILCTIFWIIWTTQNDYWLYWKEYLFKQVISSALEGRNGAQKLEPFYFFKILGKYYWPWILFLALGLIKMIKVRTKGSVLFLLLGLGFLFGFSLVKWKFWYYIAPAYPAFALFITFSFYSFFQEWLVKNPVIYSLLFLSITAALVISFFPISLHRDRTPEVTAFKKIIRSSQIDEPVYFFHSTQDHNLTAASGGWYFFHPVKKVREVEELLLVRKDIWLISDEHSWNQCSKGWCKKFRVVQSQDQNMLLRTGAQTAKK